MCMVSKAEKPQPEVPKTAEHQELQLLLQKCWFWDLRKRRAFCVGHQIMNNSLPRASLATPLVQIDAPWSVMSSRISKTEIKLTEIVLWPNEAQKIAKMTAFGIKGVKAVVGTTSGFQNYSLSRIQLYESCVCCRKQRNPNPRSPRRPNNWNCNCYCKNLNFEASENDVFFMLATKSWTTPFRELLRQRRWTGRLALMSNVQPYLQNRN